MPYFLRNKYIIALILITLVIFVLMAMSVTGRSNATFVEDMVGVIVSPIQKVFFSIGKNIENSIQFIAEIKTLKQQNEKLLAEIDELKETNRKLQDLKAENERLREMLGLKERFDKFEIIGAQIIAKEPGNWFSVFTIDKGTNDGLEKNSAVITSKGLVGHIYDVGINRAKVISIIDSNSSVSGLMVRTRDIAVVKGDLALQKEGLCKMSYISKDADVIKEDLIETSGLGGIYPKGLLIGKIKEIKQEPHEISKYAIVEPAVDFKRLEQVFVIKNTGAVSE
ncbi:MAG: rod shape-determining protein MreC [Petroclostridium sp.]|jgi:rod shape-determining protein MreC|uniref:rod shape-determining protein MreC n=1 Tax=Petroclostridium xylanilyticum TaxID=1792311 RepID=UPI000B98FD86|nr:rod shape-determining protein MreC [Petroclostridium xylanilyticum]MBZ4645008.1 rod shape-determining protein MreC [Clostridia bacterium]MDK2810065.1 rod shape-determining protein MreC [Petroclostridium sp.]